MRPTQHVYNNTTEMWLETDASHFWTSRTSPVIFCDQVTKSLLFTLQPIRVQTAPDPLHHFLFFQSRSHACARRVLFPPCCSYVSIERDTGRVCVQCLKHVCPLAHCIQVEAGRLLLKVTAVKPVNQVKQQSSRGSQSAALSFATET